MIGGDSAHAAAVLDLIAQLDELQVPADASRERARKSLVSAGIRVGNGSLPRS